MKKKALLVVLFASGIWGLSEAVLGDALYAAHAPGASIYLTVIAFAILAVAHSHLPRPGGATAVGLLAMLYKLLNVPFFGCHLTGIAMLGVSWDLVFGLAGRVSPLQAFTAPARSGFPARAWVRHAMLGAVACYLGHALFALSMLYVFRSKHWVEQGLTGGLHHVFVTGTLAAAGCALLVPIGIRLGERLSDLATVRTDRPPRPRYAFALASLAAAGIWGYGVVARILRG